MPSYEAATAALSCLPMVRTVAARLHRRCPTGTVDREDLVQEGMLEVIGFCERYDPSLGVTLDAAAHARAKGAMLDFLRSKDVLSRQDRRDLRRIQQAESTLAEASDEVAAAVAGVSLERLRTVKRLAEERSTTSLNEKIMPGVETERIHFVPCSRKGPLELAVQSESRQKLGDALEKLPARYNTVLRMCYHEDRTFEEIGAALGITRDGASKAHASALKRLRTLLDTATTPVFSPQFTRPQLVWKQRRTPAQTAL